MPKDVQQTSYFGRFMASVLTAQYFSFTNPIGIKRRNNIATVLFILWHWWNLVVVPEDVGKTKCNDVHVVLNSDKWFWACYVWGSNAFATIQSYRLNVHEFSNSVINRHLIRWRDAHTDNHSFGVLIPTFAFSPLSPPDFSLFASFIFFFLSFCLILHLWLNNRSLYFLIL